MTDTTAEPVGVLTHRLARELFEARLADTGAALVTLDDLRALCGKAQRAVLDDIEHKIAMPSLKPACPQCHGSGDVPDWRNWDHDRGGPKPKPCPACTPGGDPDGH